MERYEGWAAVDRAQADSLSSSEVEPLAMHQLLSMASSTERQAFEAISLGYTEQPGGTRLREAIAKTHYNYIRPDQIIVVAPQVDVVRGSRKEGKGSKGAPTKVDRPISCPAL